LCDEFGEEVGHLSIGRVSDEQVLVDGATLHFALGGLLKHLLLLCFPVVGQGTILRQVVVVVKLLLFDDYLLQHLHYVPFNFFAHFHAAEHLRVNFGCDVNWGSVLSVEDVLLEEGVLSVHVRAVEESVAVDDIFPEAFADVIRKVILLVLQVVLVTLDVLVLTLTANYFLLRLRWISFTLDCFGRSRLSGCWFLLLFLSVIEGLLESS